MINIKEDLTKKLKEITDADFKKGLNLFAIESISIINDRVDASKDLNGANFKEYSAGYKKSKKKSGRNIKPNLQFTGEMMNSIDHKVNGNSVVIKFPERNHKKSKTSVREIAEVNDKTRSFFDLTNEEFEKTAEKTVYKQLDKIING